ncbi:POLD3 [Branchiostoma lanceolatum]|uniref:DNA polymerase delta subunit 3 n=1 Tax=Branchiostoma lanceolatum TaxID=7740 RepID=A0A8J9Z0C5_BRALA|nr:POLD3 [Branchiostoma lanceolatum]
MAASELDGMYLDNLDEFVHDEGKVITYKSLSHTLSVHVNQAKQMLFSFVEKSRKEKKPVHVTYLVNGRQKTEDGTVCKICVAKDDNLEAVKSSLETVSSVHVYSVQKADLKDSNPLYMSDYDINKNIQLSASLSAVKCPQAQPRDADEINQLEEEKRLQVLSSTQGSSSKQPVKDKVQPKKESEQLKAASSSSTASAPQPKAGKAKGQTTMAQMFTKKATKEQETSETAKADNGGKENKDSKNVPTGGKPKPKMGGMMAFINKNPTVKSTDVSKESSKPSDQKNGKQDKVIKQEEVTKKETSKKTNKASVTAKGKEDARKSGAKSKKIKDMSSSDEDEDLAPKKKKRRRIQQPESSSSSEEEMSEDEMVIPPTPPPEPRALSPSPPPSPEPSPPPSPQPDTKSSKKTTKSVNGAGGKRRKHKRVLKSKQFVNEDGFMVTEKVYESESTDASDVEEEKVLPTGPSKPGTHTKQPSPEKKKPSPVGKSTKQAGIMSFFKKKAA